MRASGNQPRRRIKKTRLQRNDKMRNDYSPFFSFVKERAMIQFKAKERKNGMNRAISNRIFTVLPHAH